MKRTRTPIASNSSYRKTIKWDFDGFANHHDYEVELNTESQNNFGQGMQQTETKDFTVEYGTLRILNNPTTTLNYDTSGVEILWAGICQNPGVITGNYSYIDNFIKYANTALNLNSGSTLNYSTTTIPYNGTFSFMVKLPKTYNGIIRLTNDNNYKIGYDSTQQKFYTVIGGVTDYSEVIKITENPFFITLLENHAVIRQYNVYNAVSTSYDFYVKDMLDLPVAFMVQENN